MLAEGTKVGRFAVEDAIGAGGAADVYRCVDAAGARYALKLLRHHGADLDERFEREARLLARLEHPGIVRYVEHGTSDAGRPYLVMEWVAGETLAARLERSGISRADAIVAITRIAGALGAAHQLGVVHRDVKPDNIVFDADTDEPRLIDFGIARLIAQTSGLTATGTTLGTPAYMSPEQARGDRDLDARSDVFSLGCVLYECVTGQRPFSGSNVAAIQTKVLLTEPPPPETLWPSIPSRLAALIGATLAKNPDARPADGNAVAARLEAIGRALDAGDTGSTGDVRRRAVAAAPTATLAIPAAGDAASAVFVAPIDDPLPVGLIDAVAAIEDDGPSGSVRWLADGTAVIVLTGAAAADTAADACARAATIRERCPDAAIAVVSGSDPGRADVFLERGVELVNDQALKQVFAPWAEARTEIARLDAATADRVAGRLAVTRTDSGIYLSKEVEAT